MNYPRFSIPVLVFGAISALAAAIPPLLPSASAVPPTPQDTPSNIILPEAAYRPIAPKVFLSQYALTSLTPRALGLAVLTNLMQDSEGRVAESLEIEYPSFDRAVVRVTAIGLADDSVRSLRYRFKFQMSEDKWQLVEAGQQFQCQPDRGHSDWGGELCS
ncbi:hypothetical protein [Oscillatoria sp. FACHB-1406]|uniref:hypothetical protein n=1 Tax=Oscillatoria sp. FACHB-1406 TaxID=2692846 RepID=UPI001684FD50|nr:hypothetical protein [Oscillatoria sp. FACHB-1406]MBD2579127.1 hypothetical protein [Oscillatoria sp. FACHB-1406]